MRSTFPLAALVVLAGCTTVSSSAWTPGPPAPPSAAPVRVVLIADPSGGEELGVVEANGRRPVATLDALVAELRARAASIGGDLVRVDAFGTKFDTVSESYSYDCGTTTTTTEPRTVTRMGAGGQMQTQTEMTTVTKHEPKTCTGTRQVEAATLTLTGRAFRTRGARP